MPRTRILIIAVFVVTTLLPTLANAQKGGGIKPGGTFKGEIPKSAKGENQTVYGYDRGASLGLTLYSTPVPISLKAGHSLTVSAEVLGTGRRICLALYDPAGTLVLKTDTITVKTSELQIEELSTTGTYHLYVCSNQQGQFTLTTSSKPKEGEETDQDQLRQIEETIKRLEQELVEAKARQKALKAEMKAKPK